LGSNLTELAKNLRKKSTDTENYLGLFLKNRQIEGIKFRRQEPLGRFILDFVSYERKIVIEVDGWTAQFRQG
jgi:very-short-patch-repair endonuclease